MRTWAHVVHAAGAELLAEPVCGREAKVGDGDAETAVEAEDVLWFKVAVVYAEGVAVFDGVEELEEDVLDEMVLAEVATVVEDLGEEVAVGGKVHDEVGVVVLLDDAVEGDDVGVGRGEAVEGDLAHVELALAGAGVDVRADEALDGIVAGEGVDGAVDDAVPADAEDLDELEGVVVDEGAQGWGRGGVRLLGGHTGPATREGEQAGHLSGWPVAAWRA